ncbi:MAG: S8 family serine peptidase, partial [Phycisphaerales bacterium]|nr:S8 family serine peptidase [Phycisphaerales bacterium]
MSYRKLGGCAAALVLALAGTAMGANGANETVYVRIAKADLVGAQQVIAPTKSIDYGSFQWAEVTLDEARAMQAAGLDAQIVEDAFTLILGQLRFDPLKHEVTLPGGLGEVRNPVGGKDLQLVQFQGPVKQAWLDQMTAMGLEPVQYIHPNTYIMWGAPEARGACAGADCVRWSGPFAPAYRLLPSARALGDDQVAVHVSFFKQADLRRAADAIETLGGKGEAPALGADPTLARATYTIAGSKLEDIARIPGVYSVQLVPTDGGLRGEMTNQLNVGNYDGSNLAFPGYLTWLSSVGFDGSGVIMANVDGGVADTNPDLINRFLPCTGSTCGGGASSSHGTHTAGIMGADGSSGTNANGGFLRGLGMAPGANMVEQVYSPTFTQANGMFTLMKQSWQNGASMSGNSWGPAGTPQGYDDDTRQVDVGARDADDTAAGNQEFLYVLSFMNGNGGTSSQGSPDEAKNIFTIGSTKAQNSGSGTQILQIDDISSNSAHGPALDGRKIPHMVAPGCYVDSTTGTSSYGLLCGTSMASPHVTGASALFFEYYRSLPDYTTDPSPALVKAAFTAVARNLSGHLDADGGVLGAPFDSKQGWGRMAVERVIDIDPNSVRYFDQEILLNNTGEEWSTVVSPFDSGQPMRIMLVWTDAPGHGLGGSTPAWNNNLDLIVEAGANTYRGNVFDASGFSTTGGVADDRNNTEGVFLGPIPPGAATIRVVATDINSDGVPGVGDATDQDFALVCYNCAVDPGFGVSVSPGSERVCAGSDAVYTVDVASIAGFTDPVTLAVMGTPAGSSTSIVPNPVTPGGSATVTISNLSVGGTSSLVFEGTSGAIVRNSGASLIVDNGAPGAATLISPADSATGVILQPTLDWSTVTDASDYDVEVASDPGFTNIVASGNTADSFFDITTSLVINTTYYWHVTPNNTCGSGATSATFSFTTIVDRPILLVDDDDNATNVQPTYVAALNNIGLSYDIWDTNNSDNEPDAAYLANYSMVIWFTGHEFGGFAGPGPAGEAALASYLDDGGCLLMSAQDYLYDRGLTAFASGYLGISTFTSDTSQTSVTGADLFAGMGPLTLSYPYTNFSDTVNADGTAAVCFTGNAGNAGVRKQVDGSVRVFLGFPLEAVANAADREAIIQTTLAACEQPVP